jgi:hypothetical protein
MHLSLRLSVAIIMSTSTVAFASDKPAKVYPGPGYGDRFDSKGAYSLREMALCIVKLSPSSAENLIATRPRSTQESEKLRHVSGRFAMCFSKGIESLNFSNIELRGFLAEALYVRDYPVDPDFSQLPHGVVPWPEEWMTASKQVNNLLPIYMMQFGSCVAAADAKGVATLVRTKVRSEQERAAINNLKSSLGPCLDSGRTFHVDAAILRALTAQGFYRNVRAWLKLPAAANVYRKAAN